MSLSDTPVSERIHISFFGCRNAGKSSLLNAVTDQRISVVSPVPGTTTDAVHKTMELLPAGPVVITDTPGLDDEGTLGKLRVEAALNVLRTTDVAVVVIDASVGIKQADKAIIRLIEEKDIPFITVFNKSDIINKSDKTDGKLYCSSVTGEGINELKDKIAETAKSQKKEKSIVGDLVKENDFVVLVVPIDKAAPKGRLILPQQQVIRDLLENKAIPVVVKDTELKGVIDRIGDKISLVITDSQVFGKVAEIVPDNIPLTSFSILFARYKGELNHQIRGLEAIRNLDDGDTVLISEGCTHHRQCGDIGSVKIPAMLKKFTGKSLNIELTSGKEFPEKLGSYKAIIHCGGCMLTEKEMKERINLAQTQNIPITNYGMVLALCSGILNRSVKPLGINL